MTDDQMHDLGVKTRMQLDQIINQMESMQVSLPLVWLYVWDVIKSEYESMSNDDYTEANADYSIDDVWNALWLNPVFSLQYGLEELSEHVRDWLMEKSFILDKDDE